MRHILCIGFDYIMYKKPAKIRIFIGNLFVDEFEIYSKRKKIDKLYTGNFLFSNIKNRRRRMLEPEHVSIPEDDNHTYFFCEFDDESFPQTNTLSLRIETVLDDNNYTNGFMTKTSLLKIAFINIFPKKVFENFDHYRTKWKCTKSNVNFKNIKTFYKERSHIFGPWFHKDLNFVDKTKKQRYIDMEYVGISGTFELLLLKKHWCWTFYKVLAGRKKLTNTTLYKHLYNKYHCNEN